MARNPDGSVIVDSDGYPIDSIDPMEWAEAFDNANDESMDALAAWFATALMTGQQNPNAEVPLDF